MTDPTGGDSRPDEQKTPPLPPTFPSTQPDAPQPPSAPTYGQQPPAGPPAGSPYGQSGSTPPPPPGRGSNPYGPPQPSGSTPPPPAGPGSNPYGPPQPSGSTPPPAAPGSNPYGQSPNQPGQSSGSTPPPPASPYSQPGGYNGGQNPPGGPGYPGGPGNGGPGYPGGPGQPPPSGDFPGKTLGIVGLIVAIFANVIGLIISIIARNQSKAAGYKNGPATAGIVVGAVLTGISVIIVVVTIIISLVTAAAVGTAVSSGLDNLPTSSAVVPSDGGDVDETQVDVFSIQVGDCLNDESSGTEVSDVPLVNCTDPHDYEVYYDFNIPGSGAYPGDDAVSSAAEDGCSTAFETFVGIPYSDSKLDYNYYTPTSTSWTDADDRLVSCVVFDPNGKVSGTLAGSKR